MEGSIGLQAGDAAPPFALPDQDGAMRRLQDFAGGQLVLFFYPRADTPGCTTEAQDFSTRAAAFEEAGAVVIGMSADPPHKLARFRDKRAMYGKSFEGITRTTFLIEREGRIAEIWRAVKVPGHAEIVLNRVREGA